MPADGPGSRLQSRFQSGPQPHGAPLGSGSERGCIQGRDGFREREEPRNNKLTKCFEGRNRSVEGAAKERRKHTIPPAASSSPLVARRAMGTPLRGALWARLCQMRMPSRARKQASGWVWMSSLSFCGALALTRCKSRNCIQRSSRFSRSNAGARAAVPASGGGTGASAA